MNKQADPGNTPMTAPDDVSFWDARRGHIRTRKGGWVIGEAVYSHGHSLLEDLLGQHSFFQVMVLHATGRLPARQLADWLEASFICLSWPDPRIWCNQIGALAGAVQTTPVAAVAAGVLAADSRLYGPGVLEAAAAFIGTARQQRLAGWSVARIVDAAWAAYAGRGKPVIVGYARPLATGDERVEVMARLSRRLGFTEGPHLSLAYEVDACLQDQVAEGINLAGYVAAFLTDHGYTGVEIYRIYSAWVQGGIHACYAETRDRSPESFLPLRCEDVAYQGPPPRPLPADRGRQSHAHDGVPPMDSCRASGGGG